MITISFLIAAALLLFLLFLFLRVEEGSFGEVDSKLDDRIGSGRAETICPPEVTHNIFSQQDFEFISCLGSQRLLRIYRRERKRVASHWIRRASTEVRMIALEHARSARLSRNLNPAAEAKLFFQCIALHLFCALLMLCNRFMSPPVLHGMAARVSKLYDQIGRVQRDFDIATRIAPPHDSGTP